MPKLFHELRERLLRAGVAPRHVRRYVAELADHFADLRAEEERAGRSRADAESAALIRLGGIDDLTRAMIEQRQFKSWCVRAPWAMFGIVSGSGSGCSLVRGPVHSVVGLADLPAGSRYALRCGPLSIVRDREYLFSSWQVDLSRRADSRRLGNRTHRRPATIEGDLASSWFATDRVDRRHWPGPRPPSGCAGRIPACRYGLYFCARRSGQFLWPDAHAGASSPHRAALSHLAIAKDSLAFRVASD